MTASFSLHIIILPVSKYWKINEKRKEKSPAKYEITLLDLIKRIAITFAKIIIKMSNIKFFGMRTLN